MSDEDTPGSLSGPAARERLYRILHGSYSRDEAIQTVVDVGAAYLGVDHGHVTSIDAAVDEWAVVGSTDAPEGPYPAGLTAKLSDAYCRRTMEQVTPLALHHAVEQGWADDHAYDLHRLETYVGIRIDVFGEPYGTICFVDPEARPGEFSEAELVFVELASQVLKKVLESSHYEKEIANRTRLILVLTRVLRHNLRNDLNVVQGYAQILQDRGSDEVAAMSAAIEAKARRLLALAEKSRQMEALTRDVPLTRPIDVVPVVQEAVEELRQNHGDVDVSLDTPDGAVAVAAPALEDAVAELLQNAATHTGPDPDVRASVSVDPDTVSVRVADDGPGLSRAERRILTEQDETALDHGSGLGLALVYWVVTNLDGEITVDSAAAGTTVELEFQRAERSFSKARP